MAMSRLTRNLLAALLLPLAVTRGGVTQTAPLPSDTTSTDESAVRPGLWVRVVQSNLINEKFDELDHMADHYRQDKTRLPGGDWRLHVFYGVLDAPQQTDKDTRDHLAHLEHWMTQRPASVTARVALASSLHRWAWVARGNGLADTVTPEGWRLFNERIKESQTVLEGSASMSPMCPQWYVEMMTVGLAQGWDNARIKQVFDRGIQFEPDYYYLYLHYANYLLPKWEGQPGASSAFAKSSADNLGGDAGDLLYFQIATVLIKRGDGNFPVQEMDWQRIQRGYRALSTQYGTSRRTMNQLAFMAYKYRDAAVAGQQFALIGDQWAPGIWRDRQFFDRARDWAGESRAAITSQPSK